MKRENIPNGEKAKNLIKKIEEKLEGIEISNTTIETEGKALYEISKIFSRIDL